MNEKKDTSKTMCENCGKFEARTRDYRDFDGCVGKVLSCRWCANLDDVALYQIRNERVDPLSFYDNIPYEDLEDYELQELHDLKYKEIAEQLDEFDILNELLSIERELTQREE